MKTRSILSMLLIAALCVGFIACGSDSDPVSQESAPLNPEAVSPLVGVWDDANGTLIEFYSDGIGMWVEDYARKSAQWETFLWTYGNEPATLIMDFGDETERYQVLSLNDREMAWKYEGGKAPVWTFFRQDASLIQSLIGTWDDKDGTTVIFRSNGTGVWNEDGEHETIKWAFSSISNTLYLQFGDETEYFIVLSLSDKVMVLDDKDWTFYKQ